MVRLAGHSIKLPPFAGKNGYAGHRIQLVQQLDGLTSVWLGSKLLHSVALPFLNGEHRPQSRKRSVPKPTPRIYSLLTVRLPPSGPHYTGDTSSLQLLRHFIGCNNTQRLLFQADRLLEAPARESMFHVKRRQQGRTEFA